VRGLGAWQIELRKAHDDPLDLDEIVLHLSVMDGGDERALERTLRDLLQASFELRPNRIQFHPPDELRVLHQVGVALKEQKVVDHRPKGANLAPPGREVESRTAGQTDWIKDAARRAKESRV
jgi:hypothetical protein